MATIRLESLQNNMHVRTDAYTHKHIHDATRTTSACVCCIYRRPSPHTLCLHLCKLGIGQCQQVAITVMEVGESHSHIASVLCYAIDG